MRVVFKLAPRVERAPIPYPMAGLPAGRFILTTLALTHRSSAGGSVTSRAWYNVRTTGVMAGAGLLCGSPC